MYMKKKGFLLIVIILELFVLAYAGTRFLRARNSSDIIATTLDAETAQNADRIYIPERPVKAGSYTILADYECDEDQSMYPVAINGLERPVYSNQYAKLYCSQNQVIYRIRVFADCDDFHIVVHFNGEGHLNIAGISLLPDTFASKQDFLLLFSLILTVDILYLLRRKIWAHRLTVFPLAGMVLLMSLPLFAEGLDRKAMHDVDFHLLRIEGLAKELRSGYFPVKLESLWSHGYGYANAVFYGDVLLYLPALLRLIFVPLDIAYKFYIVFINLLTCLISYYCFRKIFKCRDISLLAALVYGLSSYRLVNLYVRAAAGEYSAMAFLPLILLVLYEVCTDSEEALTNYRKYALFLAIGMTGLIETHLLSTEMIVFVMAVICILFFKKTFRRNAIRLYLLAVAETILLNLYFIVPFLDYYLNVPVKITQAIRDSSGGLIQEKGADILQYFQFGGKLFGEGHFPITPGLALMLACILGCFYSLRRGADSKIRFFTVISLVTLFVSSKLFPWDFLSSHSKAAQLLSQIQFPWRYLGIACLCLTMVAGFILMRVKEDSPKYLPAAYIVTICICFASTLYFTYIYDRDIAHDHFYDTADLHSDYLGNEEYTLISAENVKETGQITGEGLLQLKIPFRDGCRYELQVKCLPDESGHVSLPLYNYKGYVAKDDAGNNYEIDVSSGIVEFCLPPAFEGHITVDFAEPWYWRLAELISLSTVIVLIFRILIFLRCGNLLKHPIDRMRRTECDQSE